MRLLIILTTIGLVFSSPNQLHTNSDQTQGSYGFKSTSSQANYGVSSGGTVPSSDALTTYSLSSDTQGDSSSSGGSSLASGTSGGSTFGQIGSYPGSSYGSLGYSPVPGFYEKSYNAFSTGPASGFSSQSTGSTSSSIASSRSSSAAHNGAIIASYPGHYSTYGSSGYSPVPSPDIYGKSYGGSSYSGFSTDPGSISTHSNQYSSEGTTSTSSGSSEDALSRSGALKSFAFSQNQQYSSPGYSTFPFYQGSQATNLGKSAYSGKSYTSQPRYGQFYTKSYPYASGINQNTASVFGAQADAAYLSGKNVAYGTGSGITSTDSSKSISQDFGSRIASIQSPKPTVSQFAYGYNSGTSGSGFRSGLSSVKPLGSYTNVGTSGYSSIGGTSASVEPAVGDVSVSSYPIGSGYGTGSKGFISSSSGSSGYGTAYRSGSSPAITSYQSRIGSGASGYSGFGGSSTSQTGISGESASYPIGSGGIAGSKGFVSSSGYGTTTGSTAFRSGLTPTTSYQSKGSGAYSRGSQTSGFYGGSASYPSGSGFNAGSKTLVSSVSGSPGAFSTQPHHTSISQIPSYVAPSQTSGISGASKTSQISTGSSGLYSGQYGYKKSTDSSQINTGVESSGLTSRIASGVSSAQSGRGSTKYYDASVKTASTVEAESAGVDTSLPKSYGTFGGQYYSQGFGTVQKSVNPSAYYQKQYSGVPSYTQGYYDSSFEYGVGKSVYPTSSAFSNAGLVGSGLSKFSGSLGGGQIYGSSAGLTSGAFSPRSDAGVSGVGSGYPGSGSYGQTYGVYQVPSWDGSYYTGSHGINGGYYGYDAKAYSLPATSYNYGVTNGYYNPYDTAQKVDDNINNAVLGTSGDLTGNIALQQGSTRSISGKSLSPNVETSS